MFISDKGCLLRKTVSGEHYLLLVFFLRESGLKYALARISRGKANGSTLPDLFQSGTVILEQKDPGKPAFMKDFSLEASRDDIARTYSALKVASELARFYERNLVHMEHFEEAWDLLLRALNSISAKPFPEAILLKTYFVFARNEGYPVVAHWLNRKKPAEKAAITTALQNPLESLTEDPGRLRGWVEDLNRFFTAETDLLPPGA